MNNIFSHIEYLLYSHDCVIVPRLGGFMVRSVSAEYDPLTSRFLPPRRQIIFNPELTHSDGLLVASVARKNKISYNQASAIVTDEVAKILSALSQPGSRFRAGELGLLMRAPHGVIVFEPARRYFSTPALFNLPGLDVTTVAERDEAMAAATRRGNRLTFGNLMRVAASIIALIAIGFLTTTPLPVDTADIQLASLSLPKITIPEPQEQFELSPIEIEFNIAVPQTGDTPEAPEESEKNNLRISETDPYYLVVASLDTKGQAERFINAHKGIQLMTVEHDYKIRVIAATAKSAAELTELHKKELIDEFPLAWACHR